MTAQRRRRKKSWISWLILIILLAAAIVMVILVRDSLFGDKTEPEVTGEASAENKKFEDSKKEEKETQPKPEEKPKEEETKEDASLTGVVTYADKIDDTLMIRVNIDQFLSEGTCTLNLEKDGEIVYGEMVDIVDSAATATCEGFNVPAASLGAGNYRIVIRLKAGEYGGVINGEVSI